MKRGSLCLFVGLVLVISGAGGVAGEASVADKSTSSTSVLTLAKAVDLALRQNPSILRAKQEIERTRGLVIEVRAQALPHVGLASSYNQQDPTLLESGGGRGGSFGFGGAGGGAQTTDGSAPNGTATGSDAADLFGEGGSFSSGDKSWRVAIEGRQVLYSGGQVQAAMKIAKFTQDSSYYNLRDTIDQVIATVRTQFIEVLLNRALITVQEESTQLLESELRDQRNRFEAGTVARFNVLRAEVELANVRPELIRARNNYLVSQLLLAKVLGIKYDAARPAKLPFEVRGELIVNGPSASLIEALALAKARRAFLQVQRQNILIEAQQIKVATAGYKPRLSANTGHETRNSRLSEDLDDTVSGWFFGLQGNWDIFDGFETYGRVKQAKARLESARINYEDSVQQVELEVQQAFARLEEAKELIRSQQKAIEQAEEALRLARDRLGAGAGTQLEVLDARVALTRARVTELQARYQYNLNLAEFDRVTGAQTEFERTFDDPLRPTTKRRAFFRPPKVEPPLMR